MSEPAAPVPTEPAATTPAAPAAANTPPAARPPAPARAAARPAAAKPAADGPVAAAPASAVEPAAPAPAAPPATPANKQAVLRAFFSRIHAGEFDLTGGKDFHRFVVKEIYPLLGNGTLTVEDFEKITTVFSARANPYNVKDEGGRTKDEG